MVKYFKDKKYAIGKEIGSGGDGVVKSAQNLSSKKECAIKVIPFKSDANSYFFHSERAIMHKLKKYNHKNILNADYYIKKDNSEGYVIMEKMDCDLWEFVHEIGRCLDENEAKNITRQVCEALEFMHSKKISHLDIKLDNILMNFSDSSVKLCDFVRAFNWKGSKGKMVDHSIGYRLTREYRPPEIANMEQYKVDKLDQWSVGVVLYYLLTASFPHEEKYDDYKDYNEEVVVNIHSQYDYLVNQIGISAECFDVLCLLLNREPLYRPSFCEILQHRFFQQ